MKIRAKLINERQLELLEDAKKGDIIDLNELVEVDLSFLNNKINSEATSLYQKNIDAQYELKVKELNNDKINALKDLESKKNKEIYDLNNKIINLNKDNEFNLNKIKLEIKNEYEKQIIELKNKINNKDFEKDNALKDLENIKNKEIYDLNNKIINLNKDNEFNLNKIKLDIKNEYEKQIIELKNDLNNKDKDFLLEKTKLINDHDSKIKELEGTIDNLKLAKSSLNVKKLGEELEKWCYEEYQNYQISGFKNCTFLKDNEAIKEDGDNKGSKADYIFKVYLDDKYTTVLSSVCCEMKNEDPNSINKKKNSDHYKKLDADRNKKGCEYALLVSELEWDSTNDSPIKVIPDYPKMYLVRPPYFISFLGIIYSLALKYQDILLAKDKEDLELKDKQTLIDDFNDLINSYINKPIETLNKKIEDILNNSQAITKANQKIIDICNEIIIKTINTIKEKISTLEIKKLPTLYKKVDKINKETI